MFRKVIVKIKSAIEAWSQRFAVENHRSNKCCGSIAARLQHLRHSWVRARKRHGKIYNPVRARKQASQDAGMGCIGNWAGCESLSEAHTVFGESVQSRRCPIFVAIALDVVSPKSVDRDQENIGFRAVGRRRFARKNRCNKKQETD